MKWKFGRCSSADACHTKQCKPCARPKREKQESRSARCERGQFLLFDRTSRLVAHSFVPFHRGTNRKNEIDQVMSFNTTWIALGVVKYYSFGSFSCVSVVYGPGQTDSQCRGSDWKHHDKAGILAGLPYVRTYRYVH